ncbi:DUF3040 domain-containing protein [Pseudonocardiaceae bacterium YIM PH 21723]|nr:DUF3040 domain-containing protein [Pseudonocardiaceae bacterium YIM PH 21723]
MPLSEHEQRMLEQIERALYAEDPKFASAVRGGRLNRPPRRRRLQGGVLLLLGVSLLVLGVALPVLKPGGVPVISVAGFLVMFFGALLMLSAFGRSGDAAQAAEQASAEKSGKSSFAQRMEERFRKRFEDE